MRDLVKLSQRISQLIPIDTKNTQSIYNYLTTDTFCVTIIKNLKPIEILKITFLIWGIRNGKSDLNALLGELNNIYLFSTIYFSGDRRNTCYDCSGDGYVRCGECDADGKVQCGDCDGTGEVGEDSQECEQCDGSGEVDCENCNDGYVDCEYCDGTGEMVGDGLEYDLRVFASYSNKIKKTIQNLIGNDIYNLPNKVYDNYKTILLSSNESDDENLDMKNEGRTFVNKIKDSNELYDLDISTSGRGIRIIEDDLEEIDKEFY